ncbi:hypothetical protein ISCGN_026277 [Ixodes scapularis]
MLALSICCFLSALSWGLSAAPADCGIRGANESQRVGQQAEIVGGDPAIPLEFPWMVSIRLKEPIHGYKDHICGGSIINDQHIMTAAHCASLEDVKTENYVVVVGEQNINVPDATEEWIDVAEITIHPKWDPVMLNYDYAILKLNRSLDFNGTEKDLMPICLPEDRQSFTGQICTASGWGVTANGGTVPNSNLLKVDIPVIRLSTCKRDYKEVSEVYRDTMICAGYRKGGKSTCQGDSGGPLQCKSTDGRYVLAGMTSWGELCAAPREPTVFSRIATQLSWIEEVTGTSSP